MVANCSSRRLPVPTLPGLMRYLSSARGAVGIAGQQQVAVVVEVADERRVDAGVEHAPLDLGHGGGRLREVDRDAHHLGAGFGERDALRGRAGGVGRVGAGHRLHDDRRAAADLHRARAAADADADGTMHANHGHGDTCSGEAPAPRSAAVGPDLRPSAKTSRPMKCRSIASVFGRRIDEGEAGDIGDVVAVDDGAAVHDAGAHRDDLVVEGEPQVVDVRWVTAARPRPG